MAMVKSSFPSIVLAFALCFTMSFGSYEYFKFVVQWPPTHCQVYPCNAQALQSKIYTIHGLWPSNHSKAAVEYCIGSLFRYPAPPLDTRLKISWPNLEARKTDAGFWAGEWHKHGKCSEQTLPQHDYFQRAHDIWVQHNITDILQQAGIGSRTTKKYTEIESPIFLKTQKIPLLRCKNTRKGQIPWLHEVVLCWDHDATYMTDCHRKETNCGNNDINIL
uniref:Sa-RNase n=1 Tax=Fragaria viridis TaxID=64942 RepID=A0A808U6M2_FRAVI|nr:Sb-RNase [Fragaria viridis]QYW15019.1 Sa-RNase [Fragaria viridis]